MGAVARYIGYARAGAMAAAIKLLVRGISTNKIISNAFPGMATKRKHNLGPIVSRAIIFHTAIQTTGASSLPHLMDATRCPVKDYIRMCAVNYETDADSGVGSHLERALLRSPTWNTHVDSLHGDRRRVSIKQVIRGLHARVEFDGFSPHARYFFVHH
jgi:hypothetical protein